jgi:hypothetical protein
MDQPHSTFRTDAQLEAMLDQTAVWGLRCENGAPAGSHPTLRSALEAARDMHRSVLGDYALAVTQDAPSHIIVLTAQAGRVMARVDRNRPGRPATPRYPNRDLASTKPL